MATTPPVETPAESGNDLHPMSTALPPLPLFRLEDEMESSVWFNRTCAVKVHDPHVHKSPSHIFHAVLTSADRLWDPSDTLTYAFLDGTTTQQVKVAKTIVEWETYANIKFAPHRDEDKDHPTIRITFDASQGSWSYVGTEVRSTHTDEPTMNLGWIDSTSSTISASDRGTILHEFGHTLGLMHEHQSPARGSKITLKEEAVLDFYARTQDWDHDLIRSQIIDVYNARDVSNYSELDTKSIMMYFMPAAMNKQAKDIPPNYHLSPLDKAYITINYPHEPATSTVMSFQEALDIAKVDPHTQVTLRDIYQLEDYHRLRHVFSAWSLVAASASTGSTSPHGPSHSLIGPGWCGSPSSSGPEGVQHGVASYHDNLWTPGQTIKYHFQQAYYSTGELSPYRRQLFEDVLHHYSQIVNLKFEEVLKARNSDIRIFFDDDPEGEMVARSALGKLSRECLFEAPGQGGLPDTTMWFGDVSLTAPEDASEVEHERGDIYHELGHALGLEHEHLSPTIKLKDPAEELGKIIAYTPFDPLSVMLYPDLEFRKRWRRPKFWFGSNKGRETQYTTENLRPSKRDLAFLSVMYPADPTIRPGELSQSLLDLGIKQGSKDMRDIVKLYTEAFRVGPAAEKNISFNNSIKKAREAVASALAKLRRPYPGTPEHNHPLHGINTSPSAAHTLTDGDFLPVVVQSLKKFFAPSGNQIFTLQFPGRFLQKSLYAWDTSAAGHYAQFIKPLSVNESEFRLTDQMYDIGAVVGGPNGVNLSLVYEQVLNNLIPASHDADLLKRQHKIRSWLLKDVKAAKWIEKLLEAQHSHSMAASRSVGKVVGDSQLEGPKPMFAVSDKMSESRTVNRLELSDALMQEYLVAKQTWETERDMMINQATKLKLGSSDSSQALDALTRTLAHVTATREAQLASKYADAVVRGFSHTIREYMGHLDIKSSAEFLQDAKDSLREAAMSSFDGSMKVYPVQMSPIDWFESLSTSFTMEDLTEDATVIEQQIDAKSKQLDVLNSQLASLKTAKRGDMKELEGKVEGGQATLDAAQSDLARVYSTNVVAMAKTTIDKFGKLDKVALATVAGKLDIVDSALTTLVNGMEKVAGAQQALTSASRVFTQALAAKALASATDTQQQQQEIQFQITSINKDIDELTTRARALKKPTNPISSTTSGPSTPPTLASIDLFPKEVTSGGSRWQEIKMYHHFDKKSSSQIEQASATSSRTTVDAWVASYESSSSASSAMFKSATSSSSYNVEFGLRATMVTVDRGGWFQPQFFKQSKSFHNVNPDITWSKWPKGVKSMNELKNSPTALAELNSDNLLPGFPVGYIICKDITIKISSSESFDEASKSNMQESFVKSGGAFIFSMSSSESGSSSENTHNFTSCSDGMVIRIPGPQILGYMIQVTENDSTKPLSEATGNVFISDEDYDAATSDTKHGAGAAHGIHLTPPDTHLLEQINEIIGSYKVPEALVNGIRDDIKDVVVKELTFGQK